MSSSVTGGMSPRGATRARRVLRATVGILTIVTVAAAAGAAGAVPAIVARKTFLAPEPDAGLGDLGPALLALAMGFAGVTIGAALGCVFAVRTLRKVGMPAPAIGVVAVALVGLPLMRVVFVVSAPLGIAVLGVVAAITVLGWFRVS